MADNQVEFEFVAQTKGIEEGLKKVESESKKTGDKVEKNLGSGLEKKIGLSWASLAKTAAVAGAAIVAGLAFALKQGVDAAIENENAINRLNQSLASAGTFSQEASRSIQQFADTIEATTLHTAEAAMEFVSLSRTFTKTNEDAVKLTRAAIDLGAQMGISTDQAIRQLGGSLGGMAGQLGRILPQVRGLTEEQLKAGAAVDFVARRFAGAAENETKTFSGALNLLKKRFGDVLEEFGRMVTSSPTIVAALGFIRDQFVILTEKIKGIAIQGDPFKALFLGALDVARFFTSVLGPVIELIYRAFERLGIVIGGIGSALFSLFQGNFQEAFESVKATVSALGDNIVESFNLSGTKAAVGFIDGFKSAVESAAPLGKTLKEQFEKPVEESTKKITEFGTLLSGSVKNLVVSGVGAIGASLVNGGKAFSDFGKTALNIIGDFAIQLGGFLISAGLGIDALKTALLSFSGGLAIVAGLALIAVGGALKAFAGGPASQGAAVGSSGLAPTSGVESPLDGVAGQLAETEETRPQTNVAVNIQGNVLGDKRTLGREIAEALNDAFGNDGIIIARGAIS